MLIQQIKLFNILIEKQLNWLYLSYGKCFVMCCSVAFYSFVLVLIKRV
ncbi:hypothetical protein MuYL_3935 [Mucilaginibacter xinganensis]|uniref:Uncharacterized protein n=1 Tax=Mucilaginibacter xinganensis TaxID=1234841 RepID=A0A223P1C7_9SPHI|nr:hypothetical protein MuYL_3935 [Mucilaginibacter xinganensis]